jgi:ElaB/YqjD/DUF883 family membrane-anchored ribosome-binding protein
MENANEPEVIKEQMREVRTDLAEKLEALEQHLESTVKETTDRVAETVEKVTETVRETVESVEEAFDLTRQVQRHPWAMLAGFAVGGYVLGALFNRLGPGPSSTSSLGLASAGRPMYNGPGATPAPPRAVRGGPGWMDTLGEALQPIASTVQKLAVSTAAGALGKMVLDAVPDNFRQDVSQAIDDFTSSLGGKPPHLFDRASTSHPDASRAGDLSQTHG